MRNQRMIDVVAEAIYNTHWKEGNPVWPNASEAVRKWVREQAINAIRAVEGFRD